MANSTNDAVMAAGGHLDPVQPAWASAFSSEFVVDTSEDGMMVDT
jgi:hypothetical protein